MKLFGQYLKERRRAFALGAACCLIFAAAFWLYHLPLGAAVYPTLLCAGVAAVALPLDFRRVKREHEAVQRIRTISQAAELLPAAESIQGADYRQLIRLLVEEHSAYRTETNRRYAAMMEYYTVWAHQIKTPIASMRLHLQNEDTAFSRTLNADLRRIEQYVEMVLTFLRLDSESTDYVFREHELDAIVRQAVRKFSSEFIGRRLRLEYEPIHAKVVTDEKWLSFVIEQVLSNALKYTPSGSVSIALVGEKTLRIQDTGIGIAPEDLPRIFDNGFTGYNGWREQKSSGLGLYLCRRICANLGHTISIRSTVDVGTTVEIGLAQRKLEVE